MFSTRNRLLIRIAWGPRRVTSSKRYRNLSKEDAYPKQLTAATGLWKIWIMDGLKRWVRSLWDKNAVYVVIPQTKATARVKKALETVEITPKTEGMNKETIEAMIEKRKALRDRGDYEESDKIRDILTSHGVEVRDLPKEKL